MGGQRGGHSSGTVLRGASSAFVGLVYQLVVSLLSGVIVARTIGPGLYGIFSVTRTLCESALIFTKVGFDIGIVRYLGERLDREHECETATFLRSVLLAVLIISALPVTVMVLGGGGWLEAHIYHYPDFAAVITVMAIGVPFMGLTQVLGGIFRGALRFWPRVVGEMFLQPSVRLLIIVLLFVLGWRLWAVVAGTVLSFAISTAFLLVLARSIIFPSPCSALSAEAGRRIRSDLATVGKYSFVISCTVSVSVLLQRADIIMLGYYLPSEQVGQYAVVQMVTSLVAVFNSSLNQPVAPLLARKHHDGDVEGMRQIMGQHTRWVMMASLPVAVAMVIAGEWIMRIFGSGFVSHPSVIALLSMSQLLIAVLSTAGFTLSMTGRHMLEFYNMAVGLVVNVALNLVLIPRLGMAGAALATLISVLVSNALRVGLVYRVHGFFPIGRGIVSPITIGAVSVALALVLGEFLWRDSVGNRLITAAVFLAVYAFLTIKYGLDNKETLLLRRLTGNMGSMFRRP